MYIYIYIFAIKIIDIIIQISKVKFCHVGLFHKNLIKTGNTSQTVEIILKLFSLISD